MSQSPYQPPTPYSQPMNFDYYGAPPDALAPARRAGALQYVVGGVVLLASFCCAGMGVLLPEMMRQRPDVFAEMQSISGAGTGFVQTTLFVLGALVFLIGVGMLVLAGFVRRGSKGAMVTSMVITSIAILLLLLNAIGSVAKVMSVPGPEAALGVCIILTPLVLFVLLLVCLVQGMRAADRAVAQGYAMQYWQYAQQQAYAHHMMQQPQQQQQPPPPPAQ